MPSETGTDAVWEVVAEAPAKLNLGLAVVRRREDGYHDIWTIFQAIDLKDELRFRRRSEPGVDLRVEGPEPVEAGPENLVVRAAEALRQRAASQGGAEILLTKRIPVGSGLGGGSSDAAATLLGLSTLWGIPIDREVLAELALELGSDVPFFLLGGTARGEGRGERLRGLPRRAPGPFVLVIPPFRISSAEAYRALPQPLTGSVDRLKMAEAALKNGDFEDFLENLANDLEHGVARIEPRLAPLRQFLLSQGAAFVGLTGSGSALYVVCSSQGDADRLVAESKALEGVLVINCNTIDYGARVISGPAS